MHVRYMLNVHPLVPEAQLLTRPLGSLALPGCRVISMHPLLRGGPAPELDAPLCVRCQHHFLPVQEGLATTMV